MPPTRAKDATGSRRGTNTKKVAKKVAKSTKTSATTKLLRMDRFPSLEPPLVSSSFNQETDENVGNHKQTNTGGNLIILNRKNKLIGSSKQSSQVSNDDWEQDDGFMFTRSQSSQEPKLNRQLSTPEQHLQAEMDILKQSNHSPNLFETKKKPRTQAKKSTKAKIQKQRIGARKIVEDLEDSDNETAHPHQISSPDETLPLNEEPSGTKSNDNRRRSAYDNRGKRMLSIHGFKGVPHKDVSVNEYFKYLGNTPPPDRMRQLLIWCFEKNLDNKAIVKNQSEHRKIAKVVLKEIIDELRQKKISTSWYESENNEIFKNVKTVANPMNESNLQAIELYQKKLEELETQKKQWQDSYDKMMKPLKSLPSISVSDDKLGEYIENKPTYKAIADNSLINSIEKNQQDIQHKTEIELGESIDKLYHSTYKMEKVMELVDTINSSQLKLNASSLVKNYMINQTQMKSASANKSRDILRTITRLECPPDN